MQIDTSTSHAHVHQHISISGRRPHPEQVQPNYRIRSQIFRRKRRPCLCENLVLFASSFREFPRILAIAKVISAPVLFMGSAVDRVWLNVWIFRISCRQVVLDLIRRESLRAVCAVRFRIKFIHVSDLGMVYCVLDFCKL